MKNLFLLVLAVLIALMLVESALRLYPGSFAHGRKYFLNNNEKGPHYATCYPTPPEDGWNVRLNTKESFLYMQETYDLTLSYLAKLAQKAPFCIDYDIARRRSGFFPDREKTLFVTGDSFAFGEGVLDQGTSAYFLAERLPAYNVRIFAQSAADITRIERQIAHIVENYPSPRIIYFLNLNDSLHSEKMAQKKRLITDFQNLRINRMRPTNFSRGFWGRWKLVRFSRQAWVLQNEQHLTIQYYHQLYFGAENAAAINATFARINNMREIVRQAGGRLVVVIWPLIHKDLWGRYPFRAIHEAIQKRCAESGVPCIDGLPAFRQYRSMKPFRVHPLDYHPNARAHRVMADYLVQKTRLADYLDLN